MLELKRLNHKKIKKALYCRKKLSLQHSQMSSSMTHIIRLYRNFTVIRFVWSFSALLWGSIVSMHIHECHWLISDCCSDNVASVALHKLQTITIVWSCITYQIYFATISRWNRSTCSQTLHWQFHFFPRKHFNGKR